MMLLAQMMLLLLILMHHILMLIQMPFCADTDTSLLCAATDAGVDTGAFAGAVIEVFCLMLYANTNSY